MTLTVRQRFYLTIGVWLITLLAMVVFVIAPIVGDIKKMNHDITQQRQALERQYETGLSQASLRQQLSKTEIGFPAIDQATLAGTDQLLFISSLERIAASHQVTLQIALPQFEDTLRKSKEQIVTIPLRLSLAGAYPRIMQTLFDLEHTKFLLNVTGVTITPGDNQLKADILLDSFWKKSL